MVYFYSRYSLLKSSFNFGISFAHQINVKYTLNHTVNHSTVRFVCTRAAKIDETVAQISRSSDH